MKRIINTLNGGFPLTQNSLDYIQQNVSEITNVLGKSLGLGSSAFIITGCALSITDEGGTNPVLSVTTGALWYNNEVYIVDAITNNLTSGWTLSNVLTNYYWDLIDNTHYPVLFKGGASKNIRSDRKATYTTSPVTWNLQNLPYVKDLLTTPIADTSVYGKVRLASSTETQQGSGGTKVVTSAGLATPQSWIDITSTFDSGGAGVDYIIGTNGKIQYRKDNLGVVHIRFKDLTYVGTGGHKGLFFVPNTHTPSYETLFVLCTEASFTQTFYMSASGVLRCAEIAPESISDRYVYISYPRD